MDDHLLIVRLRTDVPEGLPTMFAVRDAVKAAFEDGAFGRFSGHSFGNNQTDITVAALDGWLPPYKRVLAALRRAGVLERAVVALHPRERYSGYQVLWPENYTGEFTPP